MSGAVINMTVSSSHLPSHVCIEQLHGSGSRLMDVNRFLKLMQLSLHWRGETDLEGSKGAWRFFDFHFISSEEWSTGSKGVRSTPSLADMHPTVHWEIRWSKCLDPSYSTILFLGTSSERCVLFTRWPSTCRRLTRNEPPSAGSTPKPQHQPSVSIEPMECTFVLGSCAADSTAIAFGKTAPV